MEEYYTYATGKKGGCIGIDYNAYGIRAFTNKKKAEETLKEMLSFARGLVGKIINITPLVQQGFIPREKIRIVD